MKFQLFSLIGGLCVAAFLLIQLYDLRSEMEQHRNVLAESAASWGELDSQLKQLQIGTKGITHQLSELKEQVDALPALSEKLEEVEELEGKRYTSLSNRVIGLEREKRIHTRKLDLYKDRIAENRQKIHFNEITLVEIDVKAYVRVKEREEAERKDSENKD